MKKVILGLVILMVSVMPMNVLADVASPSFQGYDAVVVNEKGAEIIKPGNEVGLLPKGTKVHISWENYINNAWYGFVKVDKNNSYYIKIGDLTLTSTKVEFERNDTTMKLNYYVYGDDVYLYSAPSKMYDKASDTKIPVGTFLQVELNGTVWGYTSYNGVSGWIYIFQNEDAIYEGSSGVANISEEGISVLTVKNITGLRKEPLYNSEVIDINIPKNTLLDYNYYSFGEVGGYYFGEVKGHDYVYVTYQNVSGWLILDDNQAVKERREETLVTVNDTFFYLEGGNEDSEVQNLKMDRYTALNYRYYFRDNNDINWYYVSYNNSNYWIKLKSEELARYLSEKCLTVEDEDVYQSVDKNNRIDFISKNEEIYVDFVTKDMLYISYDGKKGWIKNKKLAKKYNGYNQNGFLTEKDYLLYDEAIIQEDALMVVPTGSILKILYMYSYQVDKKVYYMYYVSFNGQNGWINRVEGVPDVSGQILNYINDDKIMYKQTLESSQVINEIPKNSEVKILSNYYAKNKVWNYVEFQGEKG